MSDEHWLYAFVAERVDTGLDHRDLVDAILAEERRLHPLRAVVCCPFCEMQFTGEGEAPLEYAVARRDNHLANGCYRDPLGPRR